MRSTNSIARPRGKPVVFSPLYKKHQKGKGGGKLGTSWKDATEMIEINALC